MSGGVIRHLPASTDSAFMNSLSRAVRHSVPKPSALVLNYPANPTALVAGLDFYREVVGFAKKHTKSTKGAFGAFTKTTKSRQDSAVGAVSAPWCSW